MTTHGTAPQVPGSARPTGRKTTRTPAETAYRRAWWSLGLFPIAFVLAFVVGEGLITVLTGDERAPSFWEAVVAATPALAVFVVPALVSYLFARRAKALGRRDAMAPALVAAVIAGAFVVLNLLSGLVGAILG